MANPARFLPPSVASAIGAAMFGAGGFREEAFTSGLSSAGSMGYCWGDYPARKLRYSVLWGHYDGSVYRAVHSFAPSLKSTYDLYAYVRPVDNPTYRDVEFWAQHLMGGMLDPEAGDGQAVQSALPIVTENEAIRAVIGLVWRVSNWQARKETWTRFGAAMGDAPLMVVDDPYRQTVSLKPIHPETVTQLDRDDHGNIRGYTIEEVRPDPDAMPNAINTATVIYTEVCVKVGQTVQYTTYKDGIPHDWRDYADGEKQVGPTWTESYGFVPMVLAQHRDMGMGWGMAELHPSLPKLFELDDLSSKLDDAIRKAVDPRFFFSGVTSETSTLNFGLADDEDGEDEDGSAARASLDFLSAADPAAKPWPLLANPDIAASAARIAMVLQGIERDHPELNADIAGANASGKSRRVAQERVEALVSQRRVGYDDAHTRAMKMAISIGAGKGYPGFEGFTAESYDRGELDHSIGDRPVFTVDEMDRIEVSKARADVLKVLVDSGVPLSDAAEEAGYPPERVATMKAAQVKAEAQAQAAAKATADALAMKASQPQTGKPQGSANQAQPGA